MVLIQAFNGFPLLDRLPPPPTTTKLSCIEDVTTTERWKTWRKADKEGINTKGLFGVFQLLTYKPWYLLRVEFHKKKLKQK